jgi:hypothetical protein
VPTFVVERYVPGISREQAESVLAAEAALVSEMTASGCAIRILHATYVEADETVMSFVEAPSRADVVELGHRSGTPVDRVTPAVEMRPGD